MEHDLGSRRHPVRQIGEERLQERLFRLSPGEIRRSGSGPRAKRSQTGGGGHDSQS